ncbi:iron ABC transporter ATP-binding protein [Methylocystis bryophila]|nr:iron ABC transporter ATP-binding protein [Methylocystis bryophila]
MRFSHGAKAVLRGASLGLREGEVVALLGANGAGKSTLFRLLLGLSRPSGGEVLLDGSSLRAFTARQVAQSLAYVPQNHSAPFPYRVSDIVMLGRLAHSGLFRAPSQSDRENVERALAQLEIAHLAERRYTEVSGGERQLALIARALAQGAPTLIMDEPLRGLDFGYEQRVLLHMRELARTGRAILVSTHNPEHALSFADRVVVLCEGRITADGPPRAVVTSETLRGLYGVEVVAVDDLSGARRFIPCAALRRESDQLPSSPLSRG